MKEFIYRKLIEESPYTYVAVKVIKDDNGKFKNIILLDANKSFENFFRIKKENYINEDVCKYFSNSDRDELLKELDKAAESGYVSTKFVTSNSIFLDMEIYYFQEDEYHIRFTRVSDQRKSMSEMLRKSPFIAWIKDRNGVYIDVNDKYLKLFNIEYDDIVGNTDEYIWGIEQAKKFRIQDDEVLSKNILQTYKEVLESGVNGKSYFETAKWPYTDKDNTMVLGTMGISVEVTERVKLRESIEKNEENLIDIANNIDELIMIRDEKKAIYINSYFEKLYGFKPDSLYEDMDSWYKYWDKIEFATEVVPYEYRGVDTCVFRVVKEGQIDKWIQSRTTPVFDEKGNILKKICVINDITEKKLLEEKIEELRMEFFANLSHELRTPLNVIMSSLQLINLKRSSNEIVDEKWLTKYLNITNQNALRLLRLVNNLIDITKINSGNFNYSPNNSDIVSFVENICMSVADFVERNNLEIIFDTDVEEKIIGFDLNHMERIILNLISNAIKFSKENGKILVTISTEDKVEITVKDEGIGIPEDKLDTVFERFEQVNKKMRREREGTGIGLALVKSLVELNNGTIQLNSVLDEGSEFIITLPDTLVSEENSLDLDKAPPYLKQINKMEVEFSDIYC